MPGSTQSRTFAPVFWLPSFGYSFNLLGNMAWVVTFVM